MFQLSNLTSSGKKRKRIGRGGSRGGTSGKGHKGQKARTGHHGVGMGFEGGQMPLTRRIPKRGFSNTRFAKDFVIVNVQQLQDSYEANQEVTMESLKELGVIAQLKSRKSARLKILGNGSLSKQLTVHADAASESAIKAIENAGGKIHINKES